MDRPLLALPGAVRQAVAFSVVTLLALCLCLPGSANAAPSAANKAALAAEAVLGINNGLLYGNQMEVQSIGAPFAELLGKATGQKMIWDGSFDAKTAQTGSGSFQFAFIKPPNQTALLLAKGWKLVAVAKDSIGFGTDLVALPCPGKPGEIALGGQSLAVLGLTKQVPATCVPVAQVWTSPSAVILSVENSLVEHVGKKMWKEHNAHAAPIQAQVKSQDAVVGLMEQMHTAVIGAVTPVFSKQLTARGGVLLQHQPMPFWALIAAPNTPAGQIDAARAALLGASAERLNRTLKITGWEVGSPKAYADFLKWIKS
jgi:hypothetical protein